MDMIATAAFSDSNCAILVSWLSAACLTLFVSSRLVEWPAWPGWACGFVSAWRTSSQPEPRASEPAKLRNTPDCRVLQIWIRIIFIIITGRLDQCVSSYSVNMKITSNTYEYLRFFRRKTKIMVLSARL